MGDEWECECPCGDFLGILQLFVLKALKFWIKILDLKNILKYLLITSSVTQEEKQKSLNKISQNTFKNPPQGKVLAW